MCVHFAVDFTPLAPALDACEGVFAAPEATLEAPAPETTFGTPFSDPTSADLLERPASGPTPLILDVASPSSAPIYG